MASYIIYPPIVDSYMPAFIASDNKCKIYFSLSKFNASKDFSSVHISIVKQSTGMNVVKTTDSNGRYRATGIIINAKATKVEDKDNLYYVEIENEDLSSVSGSYSGWIPGWVYKVQIRLSSKDYDESMGQAAWLNANSAFFSEWSTVCIIKATGRIDYSIPILNIDTSDENKSVNPNKVITLYLSTLTLFGHFSREIDPTELIYSYQFILYDELDNILDDSGSIFANKNQNNDSFNYTFKVELENETNYKLAFKYETINHYVNGFYKTEEADNRINFMAAQIEVSYDKLDCHIVTVDRDTMGLLKDISTLQEEEEEGRIGLKLYSTRENPYSGNLCIRRASSKDNFKTWYDIKIITFKEQNINNADVIYDYVIESGVWYRYGVQIINNYGERAVLSQTSPIMRNFNYSFLLGKDNKQLKIQFDNTMNSYKHQVVENKIDPIGSKYPVATRNSSINYKTFSINGLISFWMDENKTFCDKKVVYKYEDIVDLYKDYNKKNNIVQYDYIYERDFRQLVLDFLYDGEFKLFKSPTEGNVIVRLMDINCTPNQSLSRMIYSFSSTASEMADNTMENYLANGFYDPGTWSEDYIVYSTQIGQLQMDFTPETDVIKEIYKKYDSQGKNLGGYVKSVKKIYNMRITFEDSPLRIKDSSDRITVGNNFILNGKKFTVYSPNRFYEFDEVLSYSDVDSLILLNDEENKIQSVRATIDFLYDVDSNIYEKKKILNKEIQMGLGQISRSFKPDTNLYSEIYYKYYIEWATIFRRLNNIPSIEIEADPGTVFRIKDKVDKKGEKHIINETGQLRLNDISIYSQVIYIGKMKSDGTIDTDKNADISLTYLYVLTEGIYKES